MEKYKILLFFIGFRMIHFTSLLLGTMTGIYIAQNYDVPNAKNLSVEFLKYLKSIEKNDNDKNNKNDNK
jgi:hypothetical protein